MLINQNNQDVTEQIEKLERKNPQVYNKHRENILRSLYEKLEPATKYPKDMFSLGMRARMVG